MTTFSYDNWKVQPAAGLEGLGLHEGLGLNQSMGLCYILPLPLADQSDPVLTLSVPFPTGDKTYELVERTVSLPGSHTA